MEGRRVIGSPRLLPLSEIGPADSLRSLGIRPQLYLPGVGEDLHDPINLGAIAECAGPHSLDPWRRLDRTAWAGFQYWLFRSGPVTSSLSETGGNLVRRRGCTVARFAVSSRPGFRNREGYRFHPTGVRLFAEQRNAAAEVPRHRAAHLGRTRGPRPVAMRPRNGALHSSPAGVAAVPAPQSDAGGGCSLPNGSLRPRTPPRQGGSSPCR